MKSPHSPKLARSFLRLTVVTILFASGLLLAGAGWRGAKGIEALGGSDINLITGTETSPNVTQDEAVVWAHGQTIVVVYNDSRGRNLTPVNICGASVSTDGGASFTRLSPSPFTGLAQCLGSPSLFYSVRAGKWYASFLASGCGGLGIGQWESADGVTWISSGCIANLNNASYPRAWVDNNPGSPFYGRQYTAYNNFSVGGGAVQTSFSTNDGGSWSAPVNVTASFVRAVHMTGSLFADGTVFVQGMDEGGGGLNAMRSNVIYRSINGGANWSTFAQGPGFFGPGRVGCSDNAYFPCMYSARWRELGWGQLGVGPGGVVHYAYTASPAAGGADDPGNIFYIRSADNGASWSTPLQLNTDATTRGQWGASLSVNAQGVVLVSWYDERNTTNTDPNTHAPTIERFARVSNDNGTTWAGEMAISDVIFPVPLQPDPGIVASYTGLYNHAAFSDDGFGSVAYHPWTDGRVSINGAPQQDVFLYRSMVAPLPVIVVTTLDDHDDGVCNAADCTLREAINRANADPGSDRINFRYGLAGTIQLGSALPAITTGVILHGPGAPLLTVRRNTAAEHRIFTIENASVTLEGLTVSNGFLPATGNLGGGIFNDGGILQIMNCTLSGNHGYAGGGLYNANGGVATLSGCTLSGNSAFEGGAIDNAAISGNATLTVSNSTFSGNSASSNGGAISNGALGGSTASLTLTNCTLSGNSSPTGGGLNNGAFFGGTATTIVRNTIFKTGASGANLANDGGTITSQGTNRSNDSGGGFLVGPGDVNDVDPMLGPLQNNGGPTFTHALLVGSNAINSGNNAFAPPADQRGYLRASTSDIGAFEFAGFMPIPPSASAFSRKLHGAMPFDISLPLSGNPGVECRSGGAGGDHQIVLNFSAAVTFSDAIVTAGDAVVSSSSGTGTNSLTVNLSAVSNLQAINLRIANLSDGANTGDLNLPIAFLLGDTNGNRTVNATDVGQTKSQSGQPLSASNFRSDVNASGSINASDIGQVKAQSGTTLPP